jgi:hypothetical protein
MGYSTGGLLSLFGMIAGCPLGSWLLGFVLLSQASAPSALRAMEAAEGAALPSPLPRFPFDNWWNVDISSWPVDPGSTNYVAFIFGG